ncbi:Uncharacterized conserved protein, DUF934 family [Pseudomonas citronellolis]|uniref:Uncharacterized conserved protein, DUF934 family n=1 Tax=Pseudomonas citronellolis TaxID=53408 RepID=A0AAQ1HQP8_9PSED|nr:MULTISPECIES: DUF934 domain-containing protein [Pseudomonas]MCL6689459.1 DUF934 domain-containing protein [Pseudomonas sp. R3.Fl]MDN6871586.1 DUF934 domain-containing protein [Pseudomonas citronellolis]TGC23339.1 DUF934 domain-containing protein [Pseudomonas citronellolis]UXJ51984.1 DUF934 domain-containing protein [Pseudomonas citronellolis]SFD24486.1 Uncharacterized conserved protein, DUF934 family [Pseudomonas citronellolis]
MNNLIRLGGEGAWHDRDDAWTLLREVPETLPEGDLILPLELWLTRRSELAREQTAEPGASRASSLLQESGVWLGPDDDPQRLVGRLDALPLIAIDFPSFRDGRGYSLAYLLRRRLGWRGELRAVGEVLRDQLAHLRQCGFDAFAVRADKSVEDALKGLAGLSVLYGRSAIEPRPLFRRR